MFLKKDIFVYMCLVVRVKASDVHNIAHASFHYKPLNVMDLHGAYFFLLPG